MTFTRLLAQMTVSDLDRAVEWYARFFGREPDARPMDGLVEWHLGDAFGVQLWLDAHRAGHSAMVLDESDLDGRAAALGAARLPYEGPQQVTASRIVQLADPDGNQIVITGA
jgi:catechol 2,3-dioxygenase-like lactoylglutathione lyase family enzyme